MTTIVLPRLVGTRGSAATMCDTLPESLAGQTVTVDATATQSIAQGFADELVYQILGRRYAAEMVLLGATGMGAKYSRESVERRAVAGRFTEVGTRRA